MVFLDGEMVAAYLFPSINLDLLRWAVLDMKMIQSINMGVRVNSRQFGYTHSGEPDFNAKHPETFKRLIEYAEFICDGYYQVAPQRYKQHALDARDIPSDQKLGKTPFTNGLVNQDADLRYHYDGGNFSGAMTCTYNFRDNTQGGELIFPALRLAFACQDKSVCIFDGNKLLHGVSPIRKLAEDAYRYSVVYYTLAKMAKDQSLPSQPHPQEL